MPSSSGSGPSQERLSRRPLAQWAAVEGDPEYRDLIRAKRRFILPATVFFISYYFALPILVGYWPELMSQDVVGEINVAYLFALSQFAMAWILTALYVRRARAFDARVEQLLSRMGGGHR